MWVERTSSFYSHLPAYEDGTECSETSAYKLQTRWYYPKESIQQFYLLRSLLYVSISFSFCRFYYFLPLSVSALLLASFFHFPSYHSAYCISPAGKMSSTLLHSMSISVLYHEMIKQLRYETHGFVPKGKLPCFACENMAELSNCYQLHCILTHFLALSGVTVSLFSG